MVCSSFKKNLKERSKFHSVIARMQEKKKTERREFSSDEDFVLVITPV